MKLIVSGRYIGDLDGTTLTKKGRQVVKMHVMDGFGLPKALVNHARVTKVRLHYKGRIYQTTTEMYRRRGIPYHRPPYEAQVVLPVEYFQVIDARQASLL